MFQVPKRYKMDGGYMNTGGYVLLELRTRRRVGDIFSMFMFTYGLNSTWSVDEMRDANKFFFFTASEVLFTDTYLDTHRAEVKSACETVLRYSRFVCAFYTLLLDVGVGEIEMRSRSRS